MAEDKVRLSQVIGVFGPGAMLDLPERSVLVQGLDHWEMFGTGTFHPIEEPRLARLLHHDVVGGPASLRVAIDQILDAGEALANDKRANAERLYELTPDAEAGEIARYQSARAVVLK